MVGAANAQDQSQQDPWNGWMMEAWGRGMMAYGGPGVLDDAARRI
jgi:hypothetical protein